MDGKKEYKLATINGQHLLKECAIDMGAYLSLDSAKNKYKKYQLDTFGCYKFGDDFASTITLWGNEENYLTGIRFNYYELVIKLQKILNINNCKFNLDKDIIALIKERIRLLSSIQTEEELKKYFPIIYKDFGEGKKLYHSYKNNYRRNRNKNSSIKQKKIRKKEADDNKKYYQDCGFRNSPRSFVKEQTKFYNKMLLNLNNTYNYIIGNNFKDSLFRFFNIDRMNLYIMNKYVDRLLICNDERLKQIYVSIIDSFLDKELDKELYIHDEKGNIIKYVDVLRKYNNFILKNRKREEYVVDWVLLPEERMLENEEQMRAVYGGQVNISPDIKKYLDANYRKLKFYEVNPYNRKRCLAKAKGLYFNEGYTAYIYDNGEILLDKIATPNNIKSSIGNAIYNLNIYNFEELSPKSKFILRKDKACPIIIHDENWEDKAQKIINKESTTDSKENTLKFIKKIKKK